MLTLDWPWLLLLAPLPWLIYRYARPARRQQAALQVPFFDQLQRSDGAAPARTPRHLRTRLALLSLIWLALLLAAARPQWVGDPLPVAPSGRDLLLAVDISGSMGTEDMPLEGQLRDRLTVVKQVLAQFVERRQGDRLGLILFGTRAYIQVPLTFDSHAFVQLLDESRIGFAGEKTAIGDAIGLAVKRLTDRAQQSRVLILLTDGANTAGQVQPLEAAQVAAREGIRIHTLGIGADEMLVQSLFGTRRVNPSADLDEKLLTQVAETTGGHYFRARDPEQLAQVYAELDRLEPSEQEQQLVRPQEALFHWPLGLALLLSLLWALMCLYERRPAAALREARP
ncbi:vWA domain-containing protein [Marinobacterium sedimentorum]|uniref:vWA domain-containing protein n=1 Tax=Marinobacterium sedimentorum TaxID=2927804 RepID=UPI0020C60B44|nr:VWA domain-containing protein [Marinobacterium sedimentorum]MCP8690064.1 VWA domain-containing protein [Marinobacterium sedimentorum]